MKARHLLAATMVSTMFAGAAMAQDAVVVNYKELDDETFVVQPWNLSVGQIEDMDVYGAGGDEIGEVEDVLVDASGKVVGLSVEAGGFLGIGEKDVILSLDQVTLENDKLVTALTEEQLKDLPRWDD